MDPAELACPHPAACGEGFHLAGSAMAASCTGAAVALVLERASARRGPRALARAHPGGYDLVQVSDQHDGGVQVNYLASYPRSPPPPSGPGAALVSLGSVEHRTDGPARVRFAPDGSVTLWEWRRHGEVMRPDGPARWSESGLGTYHLPDHGLVRSADHPPWRQVMAAALAAGAHPEQLVAWCAWPPAYIAALAPIISSPEPARALADQGVREIGDMVAVLAGTMPLSWAIAGT